MDDIKNSIGIHTISHFPPPFVIVWFVYYKNDFIFVFFWFFFEFLTMICSTKELSELLSIQSKHFPMILWEHCVRSDSWRSSTLRSIKNWRKRHQLRKLRFYFQCSFSSFHFIRPLFFQNILSNLYIFLYLLFAKFTLSTFLFCYCLILRLFKYHL